MIHNLKIARNKNGEKSIPAENIDGSNSYLCGIPYTLRIKLDIGNICNSNYEFPF